jgi:hypothetical protein
MLRGEVVAIGEGFATLRLADDSPVKGRGVDGIALGGAADVMVRPEHLLAPGATPDANSHYRTIAGSIIDKSCLGETLQYEIATPWKPHASRLLQRHRSGRIC